MHELDPNAPGGKPDRRFIALVVVGALALLVVLLFPLLRASKDPRLPLPYGGLLREAEGGRVRTVTVDNATGRLTGTLTDGTRYTSAGPQPPSDEDLGRWRDAGVTVEFKSSKPSLLLTFLPYLLPVVLLIGFLFWLHRRERGQLTGILGIGRSSARLYGSEQPVTTLSDVAGHAGVKREIAEVVDFMRSPDRFRDVGARIPKGVLLVGPPGTGKTLLARAVAGEAGVPFLSVTGSDFLEVFVGVGASRVRDLFATARRLAPAIVFVDEIDAIGRARGGSASSGGQDEREQTLNQLLSEMDGFEISEGIVLIAATNRPDILDPALLRPGRFDRQISVPLPDHRERLEILGVHCKGKPVSPMVDLRAVAHATPGMSGADLSNLVNEAALHAVRRSSPTIEQRDFNSARDRIVGGQRRETMALSDDDRQRIAHHEAGHAVLACVLEHADPVHTVTILPSGHALGHTQQLPIEERHVHPRSVIEDTLCVAMGGRAAEALVFGESSTGATNDLAVASDIARRMVTEWGMSERLGAMAMGTAGGTDADGRPALSDRTARIVDEEVQRILDEQEQRAIHVLRRHERGLLALADRLLVDETVDGNDVACIIANALPHNGNGNGSRNGNGNGSRNGNANGNGNGNGRPLGRARQMPAASRDGRGSLTA